MLGVELSARGVDADDFTLSSLDKVCELEGDRLTEGSMLLSLVMDFKVCSVRYAGGFGGGIGLDESLTSGSFLASESLDVLYRGLGPFSNEKAWLLAPQASPAAFQAAGRVPLWLLDALLLDDFLESFGRRVVSITFRLSGLDPRDVDFASGVLGPDNVGEGDAGFCEAGEGSPLCDLCNCGCNPDLDDAVDLAGRDDGFDRSR